MAKQKEQSVSKETVAAYPYYAIRLGLKIGAIVAEHGGARHEVPKSVIAAALNVAEDSASLSQQIGSTKAYRIIAGWKSYSLTDEGRRYFMPSDESEKQLAMLSFLAAPTAFKLLLDRYDGTKLPSTDSLRNVLMRDAGVPKSWGMRVAQIFISSAKDVGAIDEQGFLRYEVAMHGQARRPQKNVGDEPQTQMVSSQLDPRQGVEFQKVSPPSSGRGTVWMHSSDGGVVKVETPNPLPLDLWERLKLYVEVLKPTETKEGT